MEAGRRERLILSLLLLLLLLSTSNRIRNSGSKRILVQLTLLLAILVTPLLRAGDIFTGIIASDKCAYCKKTENFFHFVTSL